MAEACAAGGLSWAQSRRLVERWADTWTEMVDWPASARVLLIDDAAGRSACYLARIAGVLGIAEDDSGLAQFRRALLSDFSAVTVAPLSELLAHPRSWDVIVLGPMTTRSWPEMGVGPQFLGRLEAALAEAGRLVVVADNRASPLRALDRLGRTGAGSGGAWRLGSIDALLARVGLRRRQVFGLLRSSLAPVLAFDLEAPRTARAVLDSARSRQRGLRLALTDAMVTAVERGAGASVAPAWLVVASRTGDDWVDDPLRPTGRVGLAHSTESSKIVRGEPPRAVDKTYASVIAADAEARALEQLAAAGVQFVPRVLDRLAERRARLSWMAGDALNVDDLAPEERRRWVARAAGLLGQVHRLTQDPRGEGDVLVHGDFTLSNCLVSGDLIAAVIDWSGARRGTGQEDLDQLVHHAALHGGVGSSGHESLEEAARAAYASGHAS